MAVDREKSLSKEDSGSNTRKNEISPRISSNEKSSDNLFIVGIDASAGGLEAFQSPMPNLPTGANFAYVK